MRSSSSVEIIPSARALTISASNMSFGALLFSTFIPVQYMGGLMVFAMISTSIGTLTFLAAIAEILKGNLVRR